MGKEGYRLIDKSTGVKAELGIANELHNQSSIIFTRQYEKRKERNSPRFSISISKR